MENLESRRQRERNFRKEHEFRQALKRYRRTGHAYGTSIKSKRRRVAKCLREM